MASERKTNLITRTLAATVWWVNHILFFYSNILDIYFKILTTSHVFNKYLGKNTSTTQ